MGICSRAQWLPCCRNQSNSLGSFSRGIQQVEQTGYFPIRPIRLNIWSPSLRSLSHRSHFVGRSQFIGVSNSVSRMLSRSRGLISPLLLIERPVDVPQQGPVFLLTPDGRRRIRGVPATVTTDVGGSGTPRLCRSQPIVSVLDTGRLHLPPMS